MASSWSSALFPSCRLSEFSFTGFILRLCMADWLAENAGQRAGHGVLHTLTLSFTLFSVPWCEAGAEGGEYQRLKCRFPHCCLYPICWMEQDRTAASGTEIAPLNLLPLLPHTTSPPQRRWCIKQGGGIRRNPPLVHAKRMRQFQLPWICRLILTAPLSPSSYDDGARKEKGFSVHWGSLSLLLHCWRCDGAHPRLLALTSIKLAFLAKNPRNAKSRPPTKKTEFLRERAKWEKLEPRICSTGFCDSSATANWNSWLVDVLLAKLEFTFCDAISFQPCIALWDSGGQDSNNLSLDGKIRTWVCPIIISQGSANLHHRVSVDFWELCRFALAEDPALCN